MASEAQELGCYDQTVGRVKREREIKLDSWPDKFDYVSDLVLNLLNDNDVVINYYATDKGYWVTWTHGHINLGNVSKDEAKIFDDEKKLINKLVIIAVFLYVLILIIAPIVVGSWSLIDRDGWCPGTARQILAK